VTEIFKLVATAAAELEEARAVFLIAKTTIPILRYLSTK
jgi:hypothetical protein